MSPASLALSVLRNRTANIARVRNYRPVDSRLLERKGFEPFTDDTLQGYPSVFARSFWKVSRRYLIAE